MTQAVQTMTRNLLRFVCLESLYIFPIYPSLFFQCPSCILFWSIFLYLVILVLYGQSSIKQIGKTSIPSLCRKMTTLKLHLWLFKQWQETCLDLYAWNCYIISYLSKFISSVPSLFFFWSMHPSSPKKKWYLFLLTHEFDLRYGYKELLEEINTIDSLVTVLFSPSQDLKLWN